MPKQIIEISTRTIFKIVLILLGLWLLYFISDILLLLFIAVIVVSAMEPAVSFLQRKKIPRTLGVLILYLFLLSLTSLFISFFVPPIVSQFEELFLQFPVLLQNAQDSFGILADFFETNHINVDTQKIFDNFGNSLASLPQNIFSGVAGVFSGILSTIALFSLAFYMSAQEDGIKNFIVSIVPKKHKEYAADLTERVKSKIGSWMAGQLLLMVIIFVLTYAGLLLVGVPYALTLAVLAGLLEIIPYIGPIISAIPGIILGFLVSPTVGFLSLVVYVGIQQLENNVVVPQVMKKTVGLHPVTVIIALLVGARLGGTWEAILAVPVATAISLFVGDFMNGKNGEMGIGKNDNIEKK